MQHSLSRLDPDGLLEYSVVFTDRSLNHMSRLFQGVMREISGMLKETYHAHAVALVPGGGTCGMEAVARQFAADKTVLVLRNGWFSYRWSQILERGAIPRSAGVLKARPVETGTCPAFAPAPIDEVVGVIEHHKPDVVFAPHVETASGIMLPSAYLEKVAAATHAVGGLFVLDCVASGAIWLDMHKTGIDVLISAPQKTWSAGACAAMVMFSEAAESRMTSSRSSSFALDLKQWREVMAAYEQGFHKYYATLPTEAIRGLRDGMRETLDMGLANACAAQQRLGDRVRALLAQHGFKSVAASDFAAPSVVVSYTSDDSIHAGSAFAAQNVQIAAGVPLACDEPDDFKTFRLGLFGLDKLGDVDSAVERLDVALRAIRG